MDKVPALVAILQAVLDALHNIVLDYNGFEGALNPGARKCLQNAEEQLDNTLKWLDGIEDITLVQFR